MFGVESSIDLSRISGLRKHTKTDDDDKGLLV